MKLKYLEPMYGFEPEITHVAVPIGAESRLGEMAARLVGTDDLIAVYVPEGTADVYEVPGMRGKVVGAVKLLPMPKGRSTQDYFYNDWDGTRRWPNGWPCKAVYAPPIQKCPLLRTAVDFLHGLDNFGPYVSRLQYGPIDLDGKMAKYLLGFFKKYPQLE